MGGHAQCLLHCELMLFRVPSQQLVLGLVQLGLSHLQRPSNMYHVTWVYKNPAEQDSRGTYGQELRTQARQQESQPSLTPVTKDPSTCRDGRPTHYGGLDMPNTPAEQQSKIDRPNEHCCDHPKKNA